MKNLLIGLSITIFSTVAFAAKSPKATGASTAVKLRVASDYQCYLGQAPIGKFKETTSYVVREPSSGRYEVYSKTDNAIVAVCHSIIYLD